MAEVILSMEAAHVSNAQQSIRSHPPNIFDSELDMTRSLRQNAIRFDERFHEQNNSSASYNH